MFSPIEVQGGEICSFATLHDGSEASAYFTIKSQIKDGDLKLFMDCASTSKSLIIYLASGETELDHSDREYLVLNVRKNGQYQCVPYSGQNIPANDAMELEKDVVISNRNSERWQALISIPFFFLPTPGEVENDDLMLRWMLNVVVETPKKGDWLSIVKLPKSAGAYDQHALDSFAHLLISDSDSALLRTISRASTANPSASRGISKFLDEIASSPDVADAKTRSLLAEDGKCDIGSGEVRQLFIESTPSATEEISSKNLYGIVEKVQAACPLSVESQALLSYYDDVLRLVMRNDAEFSEQVLFINEFWSRHGWSHTRVVLVLTYSPLECKLYLLESVKKKLICALPWTNTKPVAATLVSNVRFDVEVIEDEKRKRKYHFFDQENLGIVPTWVETIVQISKLKDRYVRQVLGPRAHQEMQANLARLKKESSMRKYCVIT